MNPLSSPDGVPVLEAAGLRLSVGGAVRWCGERWLVTALHSHPQHGRFARIETGDGRYDLVHVNGSDGALEPLGPSA